MQIKCMYMDLRSSFGAVRPFIYLLWGHVQQTSGLLCCRPVEEQTPSRHTADGAVAHNQAAYWVRKVKQAWLTS